MRAMNSNIDVSPNFGILDGIGILVALCESLMDLSLREVFLGGFKTSVVLPDDNETSLDIPVVRKPLEFFLLN